MSVSRRTVLGGLGAGLVASAVWPRNGMSAGNSALDTSQLIYLTPMMMGGKKESRCHGEVWFVHRGGEVFVVTQHDAWRAEAVRKGLDQATIWVGEFGPWKSANERYREAPRMRLSGRLETDPKVHADLLEDFGAKYAAEWGKWGPRFQKGLAGGSRVMLRYQVQN